MVSSGDPLRKSALITGATGQDGSYLAELLLEKGFTALNGGPHPLTRSASIIYTSTRMKLHPPSSSITET